MPATSGQIAPAQQAGRAQPQTTVEPPGGPFLRHTQPGRRAQWVVTSQALGTLVQQPMIAVPGYIARYRLRFALTGGSATAASASSSADNPFNVVALLTLRDAFGTVLITGPGFEVLRLIPKWSGCFGIGPAGDPTFLPSFSAFSSSTSNFANATFATALPLELAKCYGLVSGANASLLPSLLIQLNPFSTLLTATQNGQTAPVLEIDTDVDFYWLPEGMDVAPPGLGTTQQWSLQQCSPTIGSAATAAVNLPRLGGFLSTLIFILRDSTQARIDGYGTRFRFYVDGVPLYDTRFDTFTDDMAMQFWGFGALNPQLAGTATTQPFPPRETGVVVITRKNSLAQAIFGLFDTGEHFLSTNPGTSIQFECTPWGTIANAPAVLNVLAGQVVPAGSLIQGLPEI